MRSLAYPRFPLTTRPWPATAFRLEAIRGGWACVLLLLTLVGCATAPKSSTVPNLYETKDAVREYVSSGRYDREIAGVVDQALSCLKQRAARRSDPDPEPGGKLAIVLDIDETALSNLRWLKVNDWGVIMEGATNAVNGPLGLLEWLASAESKVIAPSLNLVRNAQQLGVAVFFITARPERLRAVTERNLQSTGYTWTGLMLKPPRPKDAPKPSSESEYKTDARRQITQQGYTIILSLGDQESDLAGGYAERTFKLPNPFYFVK